MTSHKVRELLAVDMGHRYRADDDFYKGTRYMDELEEYGESLACQIYQSDWASLRPLSGHIADIIIMSTLSRPNQSILTVHPDHGGYPGISDEGGYSQFVNMRNLYFPYDTGRMNIDVEESRQLIEKAKPSLVIFGQSYFLFPHPVKQLVDTCRSVGARIGFDGSHVLGLIAGKQFQDPLAEGAEVLFGSTHKSLFGPQGGIILGMNEAKEEVKNRQFPGLVDNAHWNRIAALTWALAEAKRYGKKYATQVILNAKTLGKSLHEEGVPVKYSDHGYTRSHQILLDINEPLVIKKFTDHLEKANIISDRGIRLGTCETTRRGMKPKHMEEIAALISRVYKGESPRVIRRSVIKLRQEFKSLIYI